MKGEVIEIKDQGVAWVYFKYIGYYPMKFELSDAISPGDTVRTSELIEKDGISYVNFVEKV
ncbi:hypothetical protein [Paenibacillus lactis]|uniref:hypothetical protein n=1 Tax=Paenibacillus lactis TaxID=228574 RepID=UPI003D7059D6